MNGRRTTTPAVDRVLRSARDGGPARRGTPGHPDQGTPRLRQSGQPRFAPPIRETSTAPSRSRATSGAARLKKLCGRTRPGLIRPGAAALLRARPRPRPDRGRIAAPAQPGCRGGLGWPWAWRLALSPIRLGLAPGLGLGPFRGGHRLGLDLDRRRRAGPQRCEPVRGSPAGSGAWTRAAPHRARPCAGGAHRLGCRALPGAAARSDGGPWAVIAASCCDDRPDTCARGATMAPPVRGRFRHRRDAAAARAAAASRWVRWGETSYASAPVFRTSAISASFAWRSSLANRAGSSSGSSRPRRATMRARSLSCATGPRSSATARCSSSNDSARVRTPSRTGAAAERCGFLALASGRRGRGPFLPGGRDGGDRSPPLSAGGAAAAGAGGRRATAPRRAAGRRPRARRRRRRQSAPPRTGRSRAS